MINAGPTYEQFLTDQIINFPVQGAVADIVAPRVKVDGRKGKYEKYDKESFKVVDVKPRKGMALAKTHSIVSEWADFETENYPLRAELTTEYVKEQEKLGKNPQLAKSVQLQDALARARELRVATLFATATKSVTLAAYSSSSNTFNVQFDDTTNSHPFKVLQYYIAYFVAQCGVYPSDIIMNPFIEYALATHPDRDSKDSQSNNRVQNPSLGNQLLNMNIVRAFMPYDSTKKNRTASNAFVWGNDIYLIYKAADVSSESPTAAKTFDSGEYHGRVTGLSVSYYPGNAGEPGEYVEIQEDVDEQLTCDDAVFIIKNVLASPTPSLD